MVGIVHRQFQLAEPCFNGKREMSADELQLTNFFIVVR
ncbi:hypothetical protein C4J96_0854 [Pseudomonas orientalis]|nr:hypothetical protein C4J96_0854 [Pseudomonas orientalis]